MELITIFLFIVSFLAGLIDSIAGGGGLLLIPALLFAGLPPQTALGTNKLAGTVGTGFAFYNFLRHKKIVWRVAAVGIIFSLTGAFLGSKTILFFNNETVGKIIVFLLPLAVLGTLLPKKESSAARVATVRNLDLKVPLICLAIGFYDGFFGPGTGSFLIMAFYLFVGLDLAQASATAKAFNLASNLGALSIFLLGGKVLWGLGLLLAVGNLGGNFCGSVLVIKKGAKIVKPFLIISLSILFVSLLWKYIIK